LTDRGSEKESVDPEKRLRLAVILNYSEQLMYYGAAFALILTVGMLFFSVGQSLLEVFETGPLETALAILDRVLLIFIFIELLNTIEIIVRENEIVAEPFLIIGLIAVVRRILLVTAQAEQGLTEEEFLNLVMELGVLTALVISLAAALYLTRRMEGRKSARLD
jgi:uncharacterized membrane protein (DUF373 family)